MPILTDEDIFIEKAGIFFENLGISQMSGRILGYPMISDNTVQSLTEIKDRLGVAKSSISTAIKTLLAITMVSKKGRPGSRMDYYELNPDLFKTAITAKATATQAFQKIVIEAYEFNHSDSERKLILKELIFFYDFFLDKYPNIFKKWEIHKQKLIEEGKL